MGWDIIGVTFCVLDVCAGALLGCSMEIFPVHVGDFKVSDGDIPILPLQVGDMKLSDVRQVEDDVPVPVLVYSMPSVAVCHEVFVSKKGWCAARSAELCEERFRVQPIKHP